MEIYLFCLATPDSTKQVYPQGKCNQICSSQKDHPKDIFKKKDDYKSYSWNSHENKQNKVSPTRKDLNKDSRQAPRVSIYKYWNKLDVDYLDVTK